MTKPRFNEKQVAGIVKKEQLVQTLAKKLEDKTVAKATDKLRLICMYSRIDELKPQVKAALTPALLDNEAYLCELYNLRLPLILPDRSRGSVVSAHLINHMRIHLLEYEPANEPYYQKLKDELFGRKEPEGWYYLKLMEMVVLAFEKSESEFMLGLARDVVSSLEENFRSIKFETSKEEQHSTTLELAILFLMSKQAEYSSITLKKIESLLSAAKLPVDFDLLLTLV